MRLAVSNIAWEPQDDEAVAEVLRQEGVDAVEVAPSKIWPDVAAAQLPDAVRAREAWQARGMDVLATQALLFGRPELVLFGDDAARGQLVEHLCHVVRLAGSLGARRHVFGSPRNRRRDGLDVQTAQRLAAEAFATVGDAAQESGGALVLEANPVAYGADFLTSAHEAAALVAAIDSAGVRLHLDSACMALSGDDAAECVDRYADLLGHVHLSVPELGPVGEVPDPHHPALLKALARNGYDGVVSIEMRPTATPVDSVRAAVRYANDLLSSVA